jgi:hypothetical protein
MKISVAVWWSTQKCRDLFHQAGRKATEAGVSHLGKLRYTQARMFGRKIQPFLDPIKRTI